MAGVRKESGWPLSIGWSVVLGFLTAGIGLLVPLAIYLWRGGRRRGAYVSAGGFGLFVVLVVVAVASGGGGSSPANDSATAGRSVTDTQTAPQEQSAPSPPAVVAETPPEPKANIYVVASKSFCLSSGIDDVYTGNGHVIFSIMLKNSGTADGSIDIVPVRHYDDGEINESAMDMMSADVPAGTRRQFRSPSFVYKAHEHEIASCGLIVDGRKEVPIYSTSMHQITGG